MRLLLIIFVLIAVAGIADAQDEPRSGIFDPFDRWFGKISAEHERLRLDNFAIALQENPDWIGYILVHSDSRARHAGTQRRANRMKRYVVCYRKIPWDRVIATDAGTWENGSMVILQPIPRASLSKPFFDYFTRLPKPTTVSCKGSSRMRTSRRG
jgi:hypothetical protein